MQLREARERANLDLKDVVDEIGPGWSISKLGRIERGESGRISLPEVDLLAKILEMDEDAHANLIALVRQAASKSWWYKYRDVVHSGFRIYADMEACAQRLTMYNSNIVPGLLQTPEYARELDRIYFKNDPPTVLDRRLQLKLERQTFITRRTKPIAVQAILHEAAVRVQVGGPKVMEAQIEHLVEMSKRANINLRVVPFSAGHPLGTAVGSFTIIEMKPSGGIDQQPVVYFDSLVGAACLEDSDSIATHTAAIDSLRAAALDEVSTRTLLRQIGKNARPKG
ncbi:helix-turn-helix domain-containing protein [Nocardia sp. CDC160]|uniref:helix-turn-helix domain-containing protein n=1 Tax=Nocardia sp. CDC160 TaxID=3112166 RepID=UPI002DBE19F9|nr:helix-turn-helix transcriptional regulator [Nocardia sp. CDC160]MEC3914061.1 helix-turn-helix transcriptional regulator [Nocardia sp. CDC160]